MRWRKEGKEARRWVGGDGMRQEYLETVVELSDDVHEDDI